MAKRISVSDSKRDDPKSGRVRDKVLVPKVAELVASQIRREIVKGVIVEGEALLPESELMAEFGVSRPTLREAFRILESESLISVTRGSRGGARVHAPEVSSVARYAGLYLQYKGTTLEDVQAARAIIEPPAARMLAQRNSPHACEQLRNIIEQERAVEEDPERFAELSTRFHERLMEFSGNETLALVVCMLHDIVEKHAETSLVEELIIKRVRRAIRSQEKLIQFVEAGDEDGAEKHWRQHVVNAGQTMLRRAGRKSVIDLFE
jgi:GntR family transcriptional repressor for pyruvate dehydrogenase complex